MGYNCGMSDAPFFGIHVSAGVVYLGLVNSGGTPMLEDPMECIRPSDQMDAANRLVDVRDRFVAELGRLRPAGVGVIRTTKFGNWSYKLAWGRFSLEAVVLVASADASIAAQIVVAEDAAKTIPCAVSRIAESAAAGWALEQTPRYWDKRAPAFAAARALALGVAR